jgi:hypothetical protein
MLQDLFKVHAAALQDAVQHIIGWPGEEKAAQGSMAAIQALLNDYNTKACMLAASLGLVGAPPMANQSNGGSRISATGNEASSATLKNAAPNTTVPMSDVFARLVWDIPTKSTTIPILHAAVAPKCSITEVDQALQLLQLQPPGAATPAEATAEPTSPIVNMQAACYQAIFVGLNVQNTNIAQTDELPHSNSPPMGGQTPSGVAAFFANATPPIIQSNPIPLKAPPAIHQHRRRQRQVFDMSSVRRSACLAKNRPMTQMQHAQQNLCRKLGLLQDDLQPVEIALLEFVAMFNGPLSDHVIAALSEMFNLEKGSAMEIDEALINLAGEGVVDLQEATLHAKT